VHNVCTALLSPGRLGLAIQVEEPATTLNQEDSIYFDSEKFATAIAKTASERVAPWGS
jgi:hypothetical protein